MKHRATIGIEISADEIRGVCVRMAGGAPQIVSAENVPTPPSCVDDEGLLRATELGDAVRRLCTQLDPKADNVVLGVTGCNLVARVMEIPPVPDSEVRSVLRGEMDHYRILPAGQSAFDFYRLPDPPRGEGDPEPEEMVSRVLLMGAEERLVASYRAVIDAANLHLAAVEPGAIAVMRALYPLIASEQAVATVIVGSSGTDILITHEGHLQFYRRIDTGVPEMRSAVALGDVGAGRAQGRGGPLVGEDLSEEVPDTLPVDESTASDSLNRQAISLLMTEVQRSIDFYLREYPSSSDGMRVRFVIDAPDAPALFEVMGQYLRSDAAIATITDSVALSVEAAVSLRSTNAYRYTVAIGLALRGCPDYLDAPSLDLGVGDRVIIERRLAPRAMFAAAAAGGFVCVGTIVAALVVGASISRSERTLQQARTELATLTQERAARVTVLERQKNITSAIVLRDKPVREVIEFVSAAISRRACLTSLAIDDKGGIFLSGEASGPRVIADIMDTINQSPMLEPIRLNSLLHIKREVEAVKFDLQTGFIGLPPATQQASTNPGGAPANAQQGGS